MPRPSRAQHRRLVPSVSRMASTVRLAERVTQGVGSRMPSLRCAMLGVALAACSEHSAEVEGAVARVPVTPSMGTIRGVVDLSTGTMTLEPATSSLAARRSADRINAAIYGNQGVTTRFYNSAVVTGAPVGGKKTLTANVGIRNLLPHTIGDEQVGIAPLDTIGIYGFVSAGPTVLSTTS